MTVRGLAAAGVPALCNSGHARHRLHFAAARERTFIGRAHELSSYNMDQRRGVLPLEHTREGRVPASAKRQPETASDLLQRLAHSLESGVERHPALVLSV